MFLQILERTFAKPPVPEFLRKKPKIIYENVFGGKNKIKTTDQRHDNINELSRSAQNLLTVSSKYEASLRKEHSKTAQI